MDIYTVRSGALTSSTFHSGLRNLARESDGTLWCAYHRAVSTVNQIFAAYSTDGGETWTEQQVTDKTGAQNSPSIAIDKGDNIHVVWHGLGWGTYSSNENIVYRKRTSGGWQTAEVVADINGSQYEPALAVDSSDIIHVVWEGWGWAPYGAYTRVCYRQRTSAGWQDHESVAHIGAYQSTPNLAIDSQDDVHVVWRGQGWGDYTTKYQIQYRKRTSGGWQTQEAITNVDYNQELATIATDSQDDVHIVLAGEGWGTNTDRGNIQYRKKTSGGWQSQEAITDHTSGQSSPTIAISADSNVHVVWTGLGWGTNTLRRNVKYRQKTSEGWQSQVAITDRDQHQYYASFIWATYPIIKDARTNRPKSGFAFVWSGATSATRLVEICLSDDLDWDEIKIVSPFPCHFRR